MRYFALGIVVSAVLSQSSALAGPIAISGSTSDPRYLAQTSITSNFTSESAICSGFGLPGGCLGGATLLYKQNAKDNSEDGTLKNSYGTVFTGEPNGGTISYVPGSPFAACPACYLIVKDGNNNPAQFLFSLNTITLSDGTILPAWDGTSAITLSGFWAPPVNGAISNVAIWGPAVATPDAGGTLTLLGAALLGLGIVRRRMRI